MAQFVSEPLLSLVTEGVSASAPSVPLSAPFVPPVTPGFPPLVPLVSQFVPGHWQTSAPPDLVAESILVIVTCVPETPLTPPSQGYVTLDAPSTATVTLAVGPLSLGQSVSMPLASHLSPALHFNVPADETPEVQYQYLMELA